MKNKRKNKTHILKLIVLDIFKYNYNELNILKTQTFKEINMRILIMDQLKGMVRMNNKAVKKAFKQVCLIGKNKFYKKNQKNYYRN